MPKKHTHSEWLVTSSSLSDRPNVGRASAFMMLMLLLSRVLGLVRDSVMTAQFGRGELTDAYILAFQIPDLLFFLIAGGALSSSFIPVFSEYLHTDREKEAWHIFSSVVTVMSLGLFLIIGMAYWQTDALVRMITSPEKAELFPLIAKMSQILLPAQFAFFIGGLMFGTLYAKQRFVAPGLGPNVYNIGIILGAIALPQFFQPGIMGMAWGALLGAVVGNFIIPLFIVSRLGGANYRPVIDLKHPGVRKVFKLMLPVVLGLSLPGVYAMIMRYFGSGYSDGIVTSLDLSNKLMQAPLGVFGQSLAIGVFPALSQFFAQQRMDLFREQVVKTCRTTLYLSMPVAGVLAVLASDVVAFLYQRGSFTAADGQTVVECLVLFCIGIPAWCLHPVLMRAYFSMQNSGKPIVIGTLTTFVFAAIAFALQQTPLTYRALPLASSIAAIGMVIVMLIALQRDSGGLDLASVVRALGQCLVATLGVIAACGLALLIPIDQLARESRNLTGGLRFALVGLVSVWVYYWVTQRMGMPETETLRRAMKRLDRRKSGNS